MMQTTATCTAPARIAALADALEPKEISTIIRALHLDTTRTETLLATEKDAYCVKRWQQHLFRLDQLIAAFQHADGIQYERGE